ncbi:hypothetical protein PA905_34110 [Planktothrix agardhii CCAP 1459/11A]|uniref:DUF928 domain-containing protein n=1 Tax=Planktothrix agardhii CCAP 1459/11A TaxID=282420 RepID=A0A4P5ZPA9_PLAAG|nr:DUF928 domain-containing protein [Planktothrix agardhii]GDZ95172.1 hypothetical protein PA905_34110 [Planktothrix agardhii CCAP 1459/11A]
MIQSTRAIAFIVIQITVLVILLTVQLPLRLLLASDPPRPPVKDNPDSEPAGTRSSCGTNELTTSLPFTPLLPGTTSNFSAKTVSQHPTFWFYIPYQNQDIQSGNFSLYNLDQKKTIYRTDFKLPEIPGFVSITLPQDNIPLNINTRYRWTIILNCSSPNPQTSEGGFVTHKGIIERVALSPDLEKQLQTANLSERLDLYIKNNLWYDATADLVEIRRFSTDWLNLLKALKLQELEQQPISGSVLLLEN